MKKWMPAVMLALGVLVVSACGEKKYEAIPINETVDICAVCKMQIKDDVYATQLTMIDGKNYKFDDIGCMEKWEHEHGKEQLGMDFVRDYNDKTWIEHDKATYVYDPSIRTSMAYGVISFKDKKSAEKFVADQGVGTIMSAKELESHDWQQNKEMMKMMMDEKGHGSEGMKGMDGKDGKDGHHKGDAGHK
ncbi:nitrous oxide reductase accessory protein NosL [Paenibacillus sp. KQZ6P-2]|uniref:Nitrous oxide reductase accessory protein NosL n=1 Tax=Paenibacillus mangrovi TaxID=2931978 RepID=A0A9X1WR89_9BACL|nr:nitrous oxide reductase accessory protein NosL [Paenibacillus mangrovi]MCJ8012475.1 nitrous oxide reductase accessory protein NosL [Paenibacillus mangrovi]